MRGMKGKKWFPLFEYLHYVWIERNRGKGKGEIWKNRESIVWIIKRKVFEGKHGQIVKKTLF